MMNIPILRYITSVCCIGSAIFNLLGCDVAPAKSTTGAAAANKTDTASSLDPKKVGLFQNLEQKAIAALDANQLVPCKQLVARGIRQTQNAGREYDLFEARFSLLQGKIEIHQGNTTNARRHFADAMAIFRIRKNVQGTFEVHLAQATLEEGSGDFAAAQREINEANKLLKKIDDRRLKGLFILQQGSLKANQMDHKNAALLFLDAAKLFNSLEEKQLEASAYVSLSSCEESMDKANQSKKSLEKAHKIYMAADDKEGAVKALHKLAQISLREGKYKKAKEQLKRVEALYIELDKPSDATKVNQHLSALPE